MHVVGVGLCRLALDLDVDRDVGVLLHHLWQGRHPEVGRLEPRRGLDLARCDAAERVVGGRAIGVVGALARNGPVAGVERPELLQGQVADGAGAVRGPVDGAVVDDDQLAVRRGVDVGLEHVGAEAQRAVVGVHGVRGSLVLAALMGDVEGAQLGPVRRAGRGERRCDQGREDDGQRQQ